MEKEEDLLVKIIGLILILSGLVGFFVSAAIYNNFPLTLVSLLIAFIGAFFLVASIPDMRKENRYTHISGFDDEIDIINEYRNKDKK